MKKILKPVFAAGLILAAASPMVVAAPASAQTVPGIATVNLANVIINSAAFKTAEEQRPVTYKQYYDQASAFNTQMQEQIQPMVTKLQADSQVEGADVEALQEQANVIQQLDQAGQRQMSQILQPVVFSQEYVDEQINSVLPQAIEAAANKKNISMMFQFSTNSPALVYRDPSYDMSADVTAELDALLPVAQLVPPPNWLPQELREQQARAAAAQQASNGEAAADGAAQPPATPAGPAPEGR